MSTCDWPSTVFLENCTGTLIHPEIVVYAAHCGADRERVWFGEDISTGTVEPGQGFSVDTEYCVVNPDFDPASEIGEFRANDYAFCKLAEPVLDVPIVPPLMGCETTLLLSGLPVTLVGYGGSDQETFGVKFSVQTVLHYIDDYGAAVIGGDGPSPCGGDSGGPAFMQMPDGTWRAFGIVSGPNFGNCGDAMWFATIHSAIPFIEEESGIDVSVCHQSHGEWNPSPVCGAFPLGPGDGEGKSWADACGGGPVSEQSATCGPAFDTAEDLAAPTTTVVLPEDRQRFDTQGGEQTVTVEVMAEVTDAVSGVSTVSLSVDGAVVDKSLRLGPPWGWALQMPPGVWEIRAVAEDWAGNAGMSKAVVIGVNEEPPPAPEPGTTSGGEDGPSSSGASTTIEGSTGGGGTTVADETGFDVGTDDGSSSATPEQTDAQDGCSCRSSGGSGPAGWLLLGLFGGLAARRRRSRSPACLSVMVATACSSEPSAADTDDGSTSSDSSSFTATLPTTGPSPGVTTGSSGSTSDDESSTTTSSTTDASSTTSSCEPGTLDCSCTRQLDCGEGLSCQLDTCVPCDAGTLNCPCTFAPDQKQGECDEGLNCFGGLCVNPQPCPYVMDGQCDEPEGTRACLEGTDDFDCCAVQEGVCEEEREGGRCPDGSDPTDCGGGSTGSTGGSTGSTGG